MWIRRFDDDLPDVETSFLKDVHKEGYFLDNTFSLKNHVLYMDGQPKVHFVGLSLEHKKKSVSYPDVDMMVFDEFIEMRKRRAYLPNEPELLLDLMETVNRLRIGRKEVQCFCLANKISFNNPHFLYWNIKEFPQRFQRYKNGLIVVENYNNAEFLNAKKNSRFGQLIEGTQYGDYAIDNKNLRDTTTFIAPKPDNSKCLCNIRIEDRIIGVWASQGLIYCSFANQPNKGTYARKSECREDEFPILKSMNPYRLLSQKRDLSRLYFDEQMVKMLIYELLDNPL